MFLTSVVTEISPPFAKPWGNYLLENLIENQAPAEISWLPQTLGWQLLAIVLVLFTLNKSYQAYQRYQHNTYRREALKWLEQCQQSHELNLYKQLPALLRKTALYAFTRTDISQLSGKSWEAWLDQQCQQTNFTNVCPNMLHQLAYMPTNAITFNAEHYQELLMQITLWIKHHRSQYAEL